MQLLCPDCLHPIELDDGGPPEEVLCPSCGSSFRLAAGSTTAWSPPAGQSSLGRFALIDRLGVGSFGTVYKAHDPELDRHVAIKVPRAGALDGGAELERFLREARSVARLRHPSIVPVHEVGQHGGVPYLVSEYVQGMTLADLISGKRLTPPEAARLIADVADALQYAHEQGVVHRDVKPSNLLLGADGRPYLMDFGLAKREAAEVTMTLEGQVLGTPAYMSPEQARGEAHRVDGRSDVYSLGVILYQLLTGRLPFQGTPRMLLHQVLYEEPQPPRALNSQVPRDLETVCLMAMAKEPARRYATARALADDLRRFLKGEPIAARPPGALERTARWLRRRRELAWALAGAAATACLAVVLALFFFRPPTHQQREEELPPEEEHGAPVARGDTDRKPVLFVAPGPPPGQAELPADLALVPPEAFGFVSVEVAALLRNPAAKGLREQAAKELGEMLIPLEKTLGVAPSQVERVVLFLCREPGGVLSDPLVIVTTTAPYDRDKVLDTALPNRKDRLADLGGLYSGPGGRAMCFVNDRTFLAGPEWQVLRAVKRARGGAAAYHPWQAALKLAAEKHLLVAGLYPPEFLLKWLSRDVLQQEPALKPLLNCHSTVLTVDLDGQGHTRLSMDFQFSAQAVPRETQQAVQHAVKLLQRELSRFLAEFPAGAPEAQRIQPLLQKLDVALSVTQIEPRGANVLATLDVPSDPETLVAGLAVSVLPARQAAVRTRTMNNLKQVAMAVHNYRDDHDGRFPPPAIYDKEGKPLLSWRVALLPYLEQDNLYREFRLDEPWDSEHNKKLLDKMPGVYASDDDPADARHLTRLQGFVGKGTVFDGPEGVRVADITDGTSNTLLIAEAASPVPWTKPADLPYDPAGPLPSLGRPSEKGFAAAFCDGSVRYFRGQIDEKTLRALITRNDGQAIDLDKLP